MLPKGAISRWTARLLLAVLSVTLSSCLYFNTWWNAKKAFNQAERFRLQRFHKNPDDSVKVSKDETDLYRRAIAKASKVIETFPEDTTWHDRSLMLIARSQERLGEYENASRKYGELVDAFPWSPLYEDAIEGKIECLMALGRYAEAEDWMRKLDSTRASGGPAGVLWLKARVALGRFDTTSARGHLEKLVAMRKVTPPTRHGEAALLLGNLAWAQGDWQAARNAFLHPSLALLPRISRFRARLRAALCLDRLGRLDDARRSLDTLSQEKIYARERPYVFLEGGRMLLGHSLYGDALAQFARLEEYVEPPEAVSEGLLIAGEDAQRRRVDYPEAMRLYELSAKAGPATESGKRARELADALADLLELRKRKVADSAMESWTFDLAELHLLRLGNDDSARAAYRRIEEHPGASYETRARASYAIAWIDAKSGTAEVWRKVVATYPGTEFAKQAQKNAGLPVTTVTRADSAEADYRAAESLWDTAAASPREADSAFRKLTRDWKGTNSAKRALYASAWIEDNLLSDSAAAATSYKRVVDSLPGTPWALRAAGILDAVRKGPEEIEFRKRKTDAPDGIRLEEDFDEGTETMGTSAPKTPPKGGSSGFGPQAPAAPSLKSPGEPDAIPPTPDGSYLSPDDFQ